MSRSVYIFKNNRCVPGCSPDAFLDQYNAVANENGVVTTTALVDRARPPDNPMHGAFEWDDAVAGESWREAQARRYIGYVVEVPVGEDEDEKERVAEVRANPDLQVPMFVSIGNKKFIPTTTAMGDAEMAEKVIRDCMVLLNGVKQRVAGFVGFKRLRSREARLIRRVVKEIEKAQAVTA